MIRVGVKPIIFLLNNKGYTVERVGHGENRKYNDIANWYSTYLLYFIGTFALTNTQYRNWANLLETFNGGSDGTSQSYTVHTKDELDKLLKDENFARAERIQLVEVMMEQLDVPGVLKRFLGQE